MRYRNLGDSSVSVSEISLGCWTLGGRNWVNGVENGWADVDEAEVQRALDFALEAGVNHFDNADVYGNGRAERLLSRLLGDRIRKVVVATKVGWFPGTAGHAYEPLHIRRQCEQSLVNLKRDFVDVYYFHHGDFGEGDRYLDDAVATVRRLRDEGKVRLIGLSAYSEEDFLRLVPKIEPQVVQTWAHAMDDRFIREGSPVARLCVERRLGFVAFSPLHQGILLDKFDPENPPTFEPGDHRRQDPRFSPENLRKVQPLLARMKARFGSQTKDLARAALQFVLAHPQVSCTIPGFRNLRQVEALLAGADLPLAPADVEFLRELFHGQSRRTSAIAPDPAR